MDASDSIRIIKCRYAELSGANPDRMILRAAQNEGTGGLKDHLGLADYNIKPHDSLVAVGFAGSAEQAHQHRLNEWRITAELAARVDSNPENVDAVSAELEARVAAAAVDAVDANVDMGPQIRLVDALAYDDTWREAEMTGPPGNKVRSQPLHSTVTLANIPLCAFQRITPLNFTQLHSTQLHPFPFHPNAPGQPPSIHPPPGPPRVVACSPPTRSR